MKGMDETFNLESPKRLTDFGIDLVESARQGKLDRIIGREKEMNLVIEILARKSKCNPLLLGESGVGKSAIIEGIAQRIAKKDVPLFLQDCSIFALDYSSLTSNAVLRGQFESRVRFILEKIIEAKGKIILFIDEIHNMVSLQKVDSSVDLANLLKPVMARSEIKIIGASTYSEFKMYLEKDAALLRRMHIINVSESTVDETVTMLQRTKQDMEKHHDVFISDEAIIAAVKMSKRYLDNSILPDKAIDLIDIACSRNKLKRDALCLDYNDSSIRDKIFNLELQKHIQSNEGKDVIEQELKTLQIHSGNTSSKWQDIQKISKEIDALKLQENKLICDIELARRDFDFSKIIVLENMELPVVRENLSKYRKELMKVAFINDIVTEKDISEIISDICGVDQNIIFKSWKADLDVSFINALKKAILDASPGQERAADIISKAMYYNLLTRKESKHDDTYKSTVLASLMLVGPKGTGKYKIASSLAKFFYKNKDALTSVKISEDGKVDIFNKFNSDERHATVIKVHMSYNVVTTDSEFKSAIQRISDFVHRELTFSSMSIIIFDIEYPNVKMSVETISEKEEEMLYSAKDSGVNAVVIFGMVDYEKRKLLVKNKLEVLLSDVHMNIKIDDSIVFYFAEQDDVDKMYQKINRELKALLIQNISVIKNSSSATLVYDAFNKLHIVNVE